MCDFLALGGGKPAVEKHRGRASPNFCGRMRRLLRAIGLSMLRILCIPPRLPGLPASARKDSRKSAFSCHKSGFGGQYGCRVARDVDADIASAGNRRNPKRAEKTMHSSEQPQNLLGPPGRDTPSDQNAAAAADEMTPEAGEQPDEACGQGGDLERMTLGRAKQIFEEAEQMERRRWTRAPAEEIIETQATAEALDEHLAALRRRGLRRGR